MPESYNDELVQVFNELAINNHFNVIGSASIKRSTIYQLFLVVKIKKNVLKKLDNIL